MKLTVKTIADNLGVAPSTVSKIINKKGNFSDELRVKVLDYIKEVGYVPVSSARVLKSNKTWTIGIIYTEETHIGLEHPFFSSILQAFKDYVEVEGYDLSFIVHQIGQHHMSYLKWCKNKKVDGVLIVIGSHNNPDVIELAKSDIPCISTDVVRDDLHTVISDNEQGMRLSIEYAMSLGIKNIGMIAGPLTAKHFLYRFKKYQEIIKENNLRYEDDWVIAAKGFNCGHGYDATIKLLNRSKEKPELLLAGSDILAFGAIRAIQSLGLRVPEDIQVIGYDDIPFAEMYNPKLTTIRQNAKEIGVKAAKTLIAFIEDKNSSSSGLTRVPVELIVRETTKPLKN
ncbi:LacI family DNA-binding transcriptional regulator [Candidatus Izemoplasma sp. B36]|uniref:LacI family DNA-binding transcriptional regulator n=1 Tax=Candidatus Izemoplasma sp. B36 TaxID=3242468 RepID=UPI003557CEAF